MKNHELCVESISCIAENLGYTVIVEGCRISVEPETIIKNNDIYQETIAYLNSKTGKFYKFTSKQTQKIINARVKEHGATLKDFLHIIDVKCTEWMGTKQEQYLRPSTLFAPSHFEDYLNQKPEENKLLNLLAKDNWNE